MVLTRDYLGKAHALRTTAMSYVPVPGALSLQGKFAILNVFFKPFSYGYECTNLQSKFANLTVGCDFTTFHMCLL